MTSPQYLIHKIWQRQGVLGALGWLALTPFSCGFSLIVRGRNQFYNRRWLSVQRAPLKVISIGNLTVGGTGKTPFVLWLAQKLTSRGYKVGILSRGYQGTRTKALVVGTEGRSLATPEEVGDEPVMLARLFPGVVIAGQDRVESARLAQEEFGLDVVILDDGFQHRRLSRDINILLFNSRQGLQNQWLLPAGPFREPLSAARRADVVIITKTELHNRETSPVWLHRINDRQQSFYYGGLEPVVLVSSSQHHRQELPLQELSGKRIVALAGIADPIPFYLALQEWDAEVTEVMEFPDHHQYSQSDWQSISLAGLKVDFIVTTEKDLVKLERFPFAMGKLMALRVRMIIEQEEQLLADIESHLTAVE